MTIKDFDMTMARHPITNEVSMRTDESAVSQDVVNTVLTTFNEFGFEHIGAGMYRAHFKMADSLTKIRYKDRITQQIETYCPMAELQSVDINHDLMAGQMFINITFNMVMKSDAVSISIPVEVVR